MDIIKRRILSIEVLSRREEVMETLLNDPESLLVLSAETQKGHGAPRLRMRCRSVQNALISERTSIGSLLDPESGAAFFKIKLEK